MTSPPQGRADCLGQAMVRGEQHTLGSNCQASLSQDIERVCHCRDHGAEDLLLRADRGLAE
eukprot:3277975-Pyramimonas_sp.AAC.1